MGMVLPELWSKSSRVTISLTSSQLDKYQHLLNWRKSASILEIGFADGYASSQCLAPILPEDYTEFVASDISKEMINYAKQHCKIPKSKFVEMDIGGNIPEEFYNRFDHVIGFNVMHLVKNPKKAFKNIYAMLKPGGSTFQIFFEKTPVDDIFDRLKTHPKWRKYGQEKMISTYYYSKDTKKDYLKDIEAAQFKDYTFNVEQVKYHFPSEEDCDDTLVAVNGTIPEIPKELYDEYIKDYLEEKNRAHCFKITQENGQNQIRTQHTVFVVNAKKT